VDRRATRTLIALAAATIVLVALAVGLAGPGRPAGSVPSAVVLRGVPISDRVVALTIDDGPSRTYTPEVLAVLKRHHAVATFFVIGRFAEASPGLVRAEASQGCEIASHTWSHPQMSELDAARSLDEVVRGARAVESVTGHTARFFRPPRGEVSTAAVAAARRAGMRTVLWDECLDHRGDRTPGEAARRVLSRVGPGDVILLHDGGAQRPRTVAALDLLLTGLKARGYRFVTLSRLYRLGGVRL
jgi:peptidoglycan/xylan/chitin deacetylase (PgdA/CDA1 family)